MALIGGNKKLTSNRYRCDPATQSALASLTFESLITSSDGRAVARKLVTALIEQQIGQELGVGILVEDCRRRTDVVGTD